MAAETSQTLDRGLRVLEVVSESPDGLTVTEIAQTLGIGRTVVYRLVVTLEQHAFLRRSADGRCRLGLAVLTLGRQVQPVVRDIALPALRLLADAVGATAHLTIVDGTEALAAVVVEREGGAAKNLARELKTTIRVIDFAAGKNYVKWDDWYLQVVNSWEEMLKI